MPPRNVFHDVALDFVVFKDGQAVVDQDGRGRGLKVTSEVGGRLQHVDRRDLEGDGLELCQQVQIHEVLVTKEAGPFATAVDGRRLDDQLDLGQLSSRTRTGPRPRPHAQIFGPVLHDKNNFWVSTERGFFSVFFSLFLFFLSLFSSAPCVSVCVSAA